MITCIYENYDKAASSIFTKSEADIQALLKSRCREKRWELKKTVDTQKEMIKKLKRGLKDIFDEKKTFVEVSVCNTQSFTP